MGANKTDTHCYDAWPGCQHKSMNSYYSTWRWDQSEVSPRQHSAIGKGVKFAMHINILGAFEQKTLVVISTESVPAAETTTSSPNTAPRVRSFNLSDETKIMSWLSLPKTSYMQS